MSASTSHLSPPSASAIESMSSAGLVSKELLFKELVAAGMLNTTGAMRMEGRDLWLQSKACDVDANKPLAARATLA